MMPISLLQSVPDFLDFRAAEAWIAQAQVLLQNLDPSTLDESRISSMEWSDFDLNGLSGLNGKRALFGLYPLEVWRKFTLATFLADLLSYSKPVDQVNFDRLLFVMHGFPQGFRVWWLRLGDGSAFPVGYSGWYPMDESTFDIFEKNPHCLRSRMVVPCLDERENNPFIYIFNYSVIPSLKKTILSRKLMECYLRDLNSKKYQGLACFTVSEDGVRIANRLGMSLSGHLDLDGSKEGIYTQRALS